MNELMIQKNGEASRATPPQAGLSYTPRFDAWENDQEYVLAGDLPGAAPEDLQLHYQNRELTIYGPVSARHPQAEQFCEEYGVGDFYRSFQIGEEIDEGAISAELNSGVLTVHLPKRPKFRRRQIAVKAA